MAPSPEITAPRVSVVDAASLDKEIDRILKEQLSVIIKNFPFSFIAKYEVELQTLLRVIVWKLSVAKFSATFGHQISKLKYSGSASSKKLWLLGLLTIGSLYIRERKTTILNCLRNTDVTNLIKSAVDIGEVVMIVLNINTLLRFLRNGMYPTFLELILKLKPVSTVPPSGRNVGYSYMTRELLWHGFTEFLVFVLPLINYHAIKRNINYLLGVKKKSFGHDFSALNYDGDVKCTFCYEVPILPHHMGCSHVFCYYCLAANRESDIKFECPECGFSDATENAMKAVEVSKFD